jgi:hypothetical protein
MLLFLLFITALAGFVRWQAVKKLPVDYDEFVYLPAAFRYQEMLSNKDWKQILDFEENMEHPPLNKLLFAVDLWLKQPQEPKWDELSVGRQIPDAARPAFTGPRLISAIGGTLQVVILALVHPVAAILLALDTYHTKYSAQVYLEGVPGLMSILAVFLFEKGVPKKSQGESAQPKWKLLILSGAALGLAAAGKYLYGIVGFVILAFLIYRTRSIRIATLYCLLALFVFFIADPFLWPNPIVRLWNSLTFHWGFSHSEHVVSSAMPWYSPFVHLLKPAPTQWHPGVFYTPVADLVILPLSILGLPRAWKDRPIWVAWAGTGLVFLLLWNTKWPQYILLVLPPLCVCAGIAIQQIGTFIWRRIGRAQ